MLERLLKYWPVITVSALTIASVFNIGYFSTIGLHFLGVMDLSNIVYSVGLVFGILIGPIIMFPDNLVASLKEIAASPRAMVKFDKAMKYVFGLVMAFFAVGLFVHRPYISITGLFAVTYSVGFCISAIYFYVSYVKTGSISVRSSVGLAAFALWVIFWIGGATAYHEAFGTSTLYRLTTKDSTYDNVRLVRSSSNGFIISRDQKIIYVPSGELKSIALANPYD